MKTKQGSELTPCVQREALARFVYRNTIENRRARPKLFETGAMASVKLPPISDADWLRITGFDVTSAGELGNRYRHCMTHHNEIPKWAKIIRGI